METITHPPTVVERILVIDDEDDCNFITKLVLKKAGYGGELTCLTSAEEALIYLRSDNVRPDIMFVDINMPAITGFDLLTTCELEGLLPNGHTSVVMFSSSNRPVDLQKALSYRCVSSYVEKALTVESFSRVSAEHARSRSLRP